MLCNVVMPESQPIYSYISPSTHTSTAVPHARTQSISHQPCFHTHTLHTHIECPPPTYSFFSTTVAALAAASRAFSALNLSPLPFLLSRDDAVLDPNSLDPDSTSASTTSASSSSSAVLSSRFLRRALMSLPVTFLTRSSLGFTMGVADTVTVLVAAFRFGMLTLVVFFRYSCCAVLRMLLTNQYRVRPAGTLRENQPIMTGRNLRMACDWACAGSSLF
mmetsp:Transcript_37802/g.84305  ORF Transcript_37802/g.84305 Transcript_37802/m.84305 type:complete len:219 (+) Transcript_37802:198-854(+)